GADDLGGQHAAAGSQHGAALDARLTTNPDLPADHGVIAYLDAAGESGLGGNDHVPAEAAVVSDVDHVVELSAIADAGRTERGAVHATVGADLDVVADFNRADLRKLF